MPHGPEHYGAHNGDYGPPEECHICGEGGADAEMHNPAEPEGGSEYVHAECGLAANWEVS